METLVYKSKIDWWVVFIPVFIIGAELALFIDKHIWTGIIILGLVSIFIFPIFIRTIYIIAGDDTLIIKCGFILNYKIKIDKIYSVNSSGSFEGSPALSFDRIAIHYYVGDEIGYVLISPKDKEGFIKALKKRNSAINIAI